MLYGLHTGHARDVTICVCRSSYKGHGISRTKEMLFQAGVFRVRRNFLVSDWHEIVILFPLHLMPV